MALSLTGIFIAHLRPGRQSDPDSRFDLSLIISDRYYHKASVAKPKEPGWSPIDIS
jgi:hypothetical protein